MKAPLRQSLGPSWTNMTCIACGDNNLSGVIDRKGNPYLTCRSCRFRILSCGMPTMARMRFFSRCLSDPKFRKAWLEEGGQDFSLGIPETPGESSNTPLFDKLEVSKDNG